MDKDDKYGSGLFSGLFIAFLIMFFTVMGFVFADKGNKVCIEAIAKGYELKQCGAEE